MKEWEYLGVDLGATSGRVVAGRRDGRRLEMREVHRFANDPVRLPDGLHWDVPALHRGIIEGIRAAGTAARSIGIDTWGVDYGLIGRDGRLLGLPFHYRDARTAGATGADSRAVFGRTGVADQEINTRHQLATEPAEVLAAADRMLLTPDLMGFLLTGRVGAERTIASTTQLLGTDGAWATELTPAGASRLLPPVHDPGTPIGSLLPHVRNATGLPASTVLTAVAGHDTASALVALPARSESFAYISCGTWALVGVELSAPITGNAAREAGFTNELGYDDTVRFQRNHTGLWLLSESARSWGVGGDGLPALLNAAERLPAYRSIIDPQAPQLARPGDVPRRIVDACRSVGEPEPRTPAETVRCILDSLALAFAATIREATALSGVQPSVVHLVGGGSRNRLLGQAVADATGMDVQAGPAEATALGNLLVQAAPDLGASSIADLRTMAAEADPGERFVPRAEQPLDNVEERLHRFARRADTML